LGKVRQELSAAASIFVALLSREGEEGSERNAVYFSLRQVLTGLAHCTSGHHEHEDEGGDEGDDDGDCERDLPVPAPTERSLRARHPAQHEARGGNSGSLFVAARQTGSRYVDPHEVQ